MIILTGGAGFIGVNTLVGLNENGIDNILIVDDIGSSLKWQYLVGQSFYDYVHKDALWDWLAANPGLNIEAVIHMGACSDTTEPDFDYFTENNIRYSQRLWRLCAERNIPLIYASSAATYGDGSLGFSDDHAGLPALRPLNAYGFSKHHFDLWTLKQPAAPPRWVGLKFFNVYGPCENHKGRMASVVFHAWPQVRDEGRIRLFKSYKAGYADGEQRRDFIYVKDVVAVILYFLQQEAPSGLYNVGAGQARTFRDLATAVFSALEQPVNIEYIDMPEDLRPRYQYFTEAQVDKLRIAGFEDEFTSLEAGVADYVTHLLETAGDSV